MPTSPPRRSTPTCWPSGCAPGAGPASAGAGRPAPTAGSLAGSGLTCPVLVLGPRHAESMAAHYLDFEKPIAELESKIEELRKLRSPTASTSPRRSRASPKRPTAAPRHLRQADAWQKTQVARHPERPHALDYIAAPDRGVHAARRRPRLRRRRGHRRRARAVPRPPVVVLGNEKGARHRHPHQAQFRHGPAGGLPQGASG